jgi:hypothetical protein
MVSPSQKNDNSPTKQKIVLACQHAILTRIRHKFRDKFLIELAEERVYLVNRLYGDYFTKGELTKNESNNQKMPLLLVGKSPQIPDSKGRVLNKYSKPPDLQEFNKRWEEMKQFITEYSSEFTECESRLSHYGNRIGEDKWYLDYERGLEHYDFVVNIRV